MTRVVTETERAVAYHERTKHHPNRFARSLGYMDWANQPDPFRRYDGAELLALPFVPDSTQRYENLYSDSLKPTAFSIESLSDFLEMSLAISAWKEYRGVRWALRCNPSSGNLHPTEGYILCGPLDGLSDTPSLYHYAVQEHGLERRAEFASDAWRNLNLPADAFFVCLTSVFWREAWKYGERAFRYCQHDAGHAIAAIAYAAAALGWRAIHIDSPGDAQLAALLGIDRQAEFHEDEREHPDALLAIVPSDSDRTADDFEKIAELSHKTWFGSANTLSDDHVEWDIIDAVAEATEKPRTNEREHNPYPGDGLPAKGHASEATAKTIFLQRRSAVDMDGHTSISRDALYTMLDRTLPRADCPPWSSVRFQPAIHLGLFVHRVDGLEPGLYLLARDPAAVERLKADMNPQFLWETSPACPDGASLYGLGYGDVSRFAAQASCGQAIAGDSAFSLGMLADFERTLDNEGAWAYRRLYWEAGMVGQVLYLEAEAAGLRSTGIGCYFDDIVHHAFGLKDHAFQSMYHFTVGGPVEDDRLTTLSSYSRDRRQTSGWQT